MKYFVFSDIHSYYSLFIDALKKSGFDENNPEHKLILCGDAFDRGNEAKLMFDFIVDMVNKDKLIYIRGNHEDLLLEFYYRQHFLYQDFHNRTAETVMQLSNLKRDTVCNFPQLACERLKENGVIDFIENKTINYFETKNYIFTHGYIPVIVDNWRDESADWYGARWLNGVLEFLSDSRKLNKTLVVGHWHCNWYRDRSKPDEEKWKDFSIFSIENNQNDKIIAIDTCTAYSGQVNILVIED